MSNFNRRDFLKISAVTAAASAVPSVVSAAAMPPTPGEINVWSTFADKRHAPQPSLRWSSSASSNQNAVHIDPSRTFQTVLGFGAAFTDSACYTLNRLEPQVRQKLFNDLFSPSAMALSVSRVCIGASDYAAKEYSFSEGLEPDPKLERFSIDHDRQYIIPILREARALNPEMWLLGSPWSPPAWMKFNKSMLGGSMRRKWLSVYARYFQRFLEEYAKAGVRINSVTPQNEVDTDQDGRMPACIWPQEYEIEFVRDHLGPVLADSVHSADIWILDHNYNLWGRVLGELEDPGVRKYAKGVAWHGYVGSPEAMSRVHAEYPAVDHFWTEGGPDFETPGYEIEWTKWSHQFTHILRNRSRSIIAWNYALDENGNPNIGPFKCAGLVTIHSKSRDITYSGQYWAMRHFSQHIKRGARIIQSTGEVPGVSHVVAGHADGSFAAVLTNATKKDVNVSLLFGASTTVVTLPPDSVSTATWSV